MTPDPVGAGTSGEKRADDRNDGRDPTPRAPGVIGRKPRESGAMMCLRKRLCKLAMPLNLSNAQSVDLLSREEQLLCSKLRVLPRPYLLIKEMFIQENERRNGWLRRGAAR
jgi:transcriptional adapter 2-alpha